jgi:MFS transporter, FSR family, fosmidomycin resistance protein
MENTISISAGKQHNGRLFSLSLAHLINDLYMNQLQVLLPYFVLAGLSVSRGAFLVSVFTITSSLVQPVFGLYSDNKNRQWLVYTGTLWMAVLLGLVGLSQNYSLLLVIVAFAGLGTAAFHPQASAMAAACSEKRKTFSQAIFIASGNVGWALTPLLFVPLVERHSLAVTPVFIIPGVIAAIVLWFTTRNIQAPVKIKSTEAVWPEVKKSWKELAKLMAVVALRSLTYFSLISFLPLYLKEKNISLISGSRLVFLMLFTGSIGGLIGGFLADKYSKKSVITISLLVASPLFYLFTITSGFVSDLALAFAGAFLLASFSVTVMAAQKALNKNVAFASGLTVGFGTGMGGLGVGLVGILAENMGVAFAVNILIWFPVLGGLLGLLIKEKK